MRWYRNWRRRVELRSLLASWMRPIAPPEIHAHFRRHPWLLGLTAEGNQTDGWTDADSCYLAGAECWFAFLHDLSPDARESVKQDVLATQERTRDRLARGESPDAPIDASLAITHALMRTAVLFEAMPPVHAAHPLIASYLAHAISCGLVGKSRDEMRSDWGNEEVAKIAAGIRSGAP